MIVDGRLAPANVSDLAMAEDILSEVTGWALADRSYGSPRLAAQGGWLLAHPGEHGAHGSGRRPG